MKKLYKYIFNHVWYYAIAMAVLIISVIFNMCKPKLIQAIVDDVIIKGKVEILNKILFLFLGVTLSCAIFGYIKEYLFDVGSSKVVLDLRKDLFNHVQTLSFDYFDNMNTGELMTRIKEDIDNIWRAVGFGIMLFIEQGVNFVVASIILFRLNWKLAIVCLVPMPVIAYLALQFEKKAGDCYERISDQGAKLNTTAQENIAGVRLVKAFGREKYEIKKFKKQNRNNYSLNLKQGEITAYYNPKIEFFSNSVLALVTTVGGILTIKGEITLGILFAFIQYASVLISPMRMIGWLVGILAMSNASLKKISKIFNQKPTILNSNNNVKVDNIQGKVVFDNVSFSNNGMCILKNINIKAEPGSTIAIMGMTGAGKSSIINLMARYYDCSNGNIYIDGINIKDFNLKILREQISIVMQDTFLFSDTVKANIQFGYDKVLKKNLLTVAKDALVHEFAVHMSKGYDTVIGERGVGLSGGQKQRVAIARALLKNSKILVLDDATSALDMDTEYKILDKLRNRTGMTKFIIAHRISAVKDADEILIIEDGEIIERGSHYELLNLKGRYYEIYCEQFGAYKKINEEVI